MDTLTARPNLLKQANLSMIRKVLKAKTTATRAEIACETGISSTTVRSLLAEMMQNGEIESIGHDESSGGRKAERYRFTVDRYYGAAFCTTDKEAHALLVNVCGEIVEMDKLDMSGGDLERTVTAYMDELVKNREIKAIGVGVPGVVEGGGFWKKRRDSGVLSRVDIGEALGRRYGIPVVMENDLNATAIGFGRCYEKEFPCEAPENVNMAYLHFEQGCVSGGFIVGGRVVRGHNHFAGELGLIPMEDDRPVDACMAEPMDDRQYVRRMARIIAWVCGILNPQYVALGGPGLREKCVALIGDELFSLLPDRMYAEILYAPEVWHDYHDGMAYLTAGKMFDEIQFIKEYPHWTKVHTVGQE